MLVVPDLGELFLAKALLQGGAEATDDFKLGLWVAGPQPNRASVLGDYTECSFPGYARKPMPRAGWTNPVLVNHMAVSYHGLGFFDWLTTSGSALATGYFVLDNAGAVLLWLEKFAIAQMATVNVPILVQPIMRLRSVLQPLPP